MHVQHRVGIIGGMSWESTALYYREVNQQVGKALGELHSADVIIHSVDFNLVSELQHQHNWEALAELLIISAQALEQAGATAIAIATNTMHKLASQVQQAIAVPLLNIIDATAQACVQQKLTKVALLGTRFTMQDSFYREGLAVHQLEVVVPEVDAQEDIHHIIYQQLCKGVIRDSARQQFLAIMRDLDGQGAQGFILGCTEISLLISPQFTRHQLLDTTVIHTRQIVQHLLGCQK